MKLKFRKVETLIKKSITFTMKGKERALREFNFVQLYFSSIYSRFVSCWIENLRSLLSSNWKSRYGAVGSLKRPRTQTFPAEHIVKEVDKDL